VQAAHSRGGGLIAARIDICVAAAMFGEMKAGCFFISSGIRARVRERDAAFD